MNTLFLFMYSIKKLTDGLAASATKYRAKEAYIIDYEALTNTQVQYTCFLVVI